MCFIRKLKHFNRGGNLAMVTLIYKIFLIKWEVQISLHHFHISLFDYYKHSFTIGQMFTYFISSCFKIRCCGQHMPGFLKLLLSTTVCMLVCLSLRLLITSDVMWHDMDHMWLVKQVALIWQLWLVSLVGVAFELSTP